MQPLTIQSNAPINTRLQHDKSQEKWDAAVRAYRAWRFSSSTDEATLRGMVNTEFVKHALFGQSGSTMPSWTQRSRQSAIGIVTNNVISVGTKLQKSKSKDEPDEPGTSHISLEAATHRDHNIS